MKAKKRFEIEARKRKDPFLLSREVDKIFMKIRDIVDEYLMGQYPEVLEPDLFIIMIEDEIDKYYTLFRKGDEEL